MPIATEGPSGVNQIGKVTEAKFNKAFSDGTHGRYPSIAMNNNSIIVVAYEDCNGLGKLYYRTGQAKFEEKKIIWGGGSDETENYCVGQRPRVAINNKDFVVEVHERDGKCFYHVGRVKELRICRRRRRRCLGCVKKEQEIDIRFTTQLDTEIANEFAGEGGFPGVAINDENVVILTYIAKGVAYYIIRKVSIDEKKLDFISDTRNIPTLSHTTIDHLTVAVKDIRVVVAYRDGKSNLYCMAGMLMEDEVLWQDPPLQIASETWLSWHKIKIFNTFPCPVVSCDLKGNVVVVYNHDDKMQIKCMCKVGLLVQPSGQDCELTFSLENRNEYDDGYYPAVAVNDNKRIIEIHVTNAPREWKLVYHFGEMSSIIESQL